MPSPVKAAALDLGLPVSDVVDDVVGVGAERGVVVAFGRLIKPHVLAAAEPRTAMLMSWMNAGAYLSDISSEGGKRERMMLKS